MMDMVIVMGVLIMSMVIAQTLYIVELKNKINQIRTVSLHYMDRYPISPRDTSQRTRQSDFHTASENTAVTDVTLPPSRKVEELLGRS